MRPARRPARGRPKGYSGGKDRERKEEKRRRKKKQMAGGGPSADRSRDGRRATELPARSPFLSQQLVSLLAPSAWIRGPGWTDWPVGEDHSQKTLLISHRLPRPHSHTLSLFLSFPPRRLLLKTVSREGRGFRKHVIMSSVPNQDTHRLGKKRKEIPTLTK